MYVDGYKTFEHQEFTGEFVPPKTSFVLSAPPKNTLIQAQDINTESTITFVNIKQLIHGPDAVEQSDNKIVVKNGLISCLGKCATEGKVVDLQNGWVTPGLVASGATLGLLEIEQEPRTGGGFVRSYPEKDSILKGYSHLKAASSIYVGRDHSRILNAAFKAGLFV